MDKSKNQPGGLFEKLAAQYGVSAGEVAREIRAAIDAAWNSTDPAVRENQRQLFPHSKPSVEEFIRVMAEQAKQ